MDATNRILSGVFGDIAFDRIPTHIRMRNDERARAVSTGLGIVGGTNILKSHMLFNQNWKLGFRDFLALRDVVLLGVGWQFYDGKPDLFSRWFFSRALSRQHIHSVRDLHALSLLKEHVPRVLYTGCPTMWEFDSAACATVPRTKARAAVFSATYYRPNVNVDRTILRLLLDNYERVYLWAQQPEDIAYIKSFELEGGIWIDRTLAAYDQLLLTEDVDVLGSRLHGGIRALSRGRRALILEIDNRAKEIGRETGLPCVARDDIGRMAAWIDGSPPLEITMPWDNIAVWKAQFIPVARARRV